MLNFEPNITNKVSEMRTIFVNTTSGRNLEFNGVQANTWRVLQCIHYGYIWKLVAEDLKKSIFPRNFRGRTARPDRFYSRNQLILSLRFHNQLQHLFKRYCFEQVESELERLLALYSMENIQSYHEMHTSPRKPLDSRLAFRWSTFRIQRELEKA